MRHTTLPAVASLLAVAGASRGPNTARDATTCSDVHIFLARGNNEPYPGRQGKLVSTICNGLDSCDYEDLVYSAKYTDLYCQTAYDGTIAGHTQLAAYANRCPDSKLILSGYSQGAQIVTDILGGAGAVLYNGCVEPSVPALSRNSAPGNMIVAAIVFGNVRHTANQPYNYGNGSAIDSQFPRDSTMLSALDDWSDILRDWCVATDGICASGQSVSYLAAHLGYFDTYTSEAAAWVKEVASLGGEGTPATVLPTSISGTVQDYATIGTATPSGTVKIDTTWTDATAVTAHAGSSVSVTTATVSATTTGSSTASSSSSAASTSTSGAITSAPTSATSSAAVATTTTTSGGSRTSSLLVRSGLFILSIFGSIALGSIL